RPHYCGSRTDPSVDLPLHSSLTREQDPEILKLLHLRQELPSNLKVHIFISHLSLEVLLGFKVSCKHCLLKTVLPQIQFTTFLNIQMYKKLLDRSMLESCKGGKCVKDKNHIGHNFTIRGLHHPEHPDQLNHCVAPREHHQNTSLCRVISTLKRKYYCVGRVRVRNRQEVSLQNSKSWQT
ncbi:hypothetical protein AMECASPLE_038811, partial [Ameca splendens]